VSKTFEIIVPCYNASKTLGRTIDSMLSQTYTNWRLWCVNDGSTDNSYEIAKGYADKDSRVLLFSGPNQGVSAAQNYARSKILEVGAEDSIVTYCGADDWYFPEHLEIYADEFEKNLDIDFLYSDVNWFFPNGSKAWPIGYSEGRPTVAYHDILDVSRLSYENPIFTPTAAHKLKCFSVGEFDSRLNSIEDWDFFCRVAKAGYKMVHIKKVLTSVTVRGFNDMTGLAGKRTEEQFKLFQQKRRMEDQQGL